MIKTKHAGIYHVSSDDNTKVHKFLIRQTLTIPGIGKKTVKETVTFKGVSYKIALDKARDEKPKSNDRARAKLLNVDDNDDELAGATVDDIWSEFCNYKENLAPLKKRWGKHSVRTLKATYNRLVKPHIGSMRALQVKKRDINACVQDVRARGLSARSEHSVIQVVRPLFEWWIDEHEIDKKNPASRVEVNDPNVRKVALEWSEIEKLYTAMYTYEHETYRQIWVWLSTGRRIGEVLSLRHEHFGIDTPYYTVTALNNKAGVDMMYRCPLGVTLPLYKGYIFTAKRDRTKPLSMATVNNHWYILRDRVNLPDIGKHDLRHVIATALKDGGVPLEIRGLVLGHSGQSITERYSSADTTSTADLKAKAVQFFLDKVFNRIDRKMLWHEYV